MLKDRNDLAVYSYPKLKLSTNLSLISYYFSRYVLCNTVVTSHIWLPKLKLSKIQNSKFINSVGLASFQVQNNHKWLVVAFDNK